MMFTGTLIEELFATVERAEANAPKNTHEREMTEIEPWLASAVASVQDNAVYDSKFLGVA